MQAAAAELGIKVDERNTERSFDKAIATARDFLSKGPPPDYLIASNDVGAGAEIVKLSCRFAFPSAPALRSTGSAAVRTALFVGFPALWQSLTSHHRTSSATAPRLPDADRRRLPNGRSRDLPVPAQGASAHARVSDHAGSSGPRAGAPGHVAFHLVHGVGTQDETPFAAQWLAYAPPCQRFAEALAGSRA